MAEKQQNSCKCDASQIDTYEELIEDWRYCARVGDISDFTAVLEHCAATARLLPLCPIHANLPVCVNFSDGEGNTALHFAAANGHDEFVEYLLQSGAKHLANDCGNYPLHWLVLNKRLSTLKTIFAFEASQTPNFSIESVKSIISSNNNEAFCIDVLAQNKFGKSILSEAFTVGDLEILQLILEHYSAKKLEDESMEAPAAENLTNVYPFPRNVESKPTKSLCRQTVKHLFLFKHKYFGGERIVSESHNTNTLNVICQEKATSWNEHAFTSVEQAFLDDTTGTAIWAAGLIGAQWLFDLHIQHDKSNSFSMHNEEHRYADRIHSKLPIIEEIDRHSHSSVFGGKHILELGAGCGIMGLVLALSKSDPPAHVTFSDVHPAALANIRENCALNKIPIMDDEDEECGNLSYLSLTDIDSADGDEPKGCTVKVVAIDWCRPETWPKVVKGYKQYDVIVGSDLIYEDAAAPALVRIIMALLRPKTGRLYYSYRMGRQGARMLSRLLKDVGMKIEEIAPPESYKQNCLAGKSDEEFYMFFNEMLECDDFVLLRAGWR